MGVSLGTPPRRPPGAEPLAGEQRRLDARLDSDGDAATKPPTDPSAMQAQVAAGSVVTLTLK